MKILMTGNEAIVAECATNENNAKISQVKMNYSHYCFKEYLEY